MQAAASFDTPGNILSVLRKKPSRLKSGGLSAPGSNVADSGQSQAQAESRQPASSGQGSGGAGGVLEGQERLDLRNSSQSDKTVVQDGPQREPSPHQIDGAQRRSSPHLEQSVEVGLPEVRRSSRQRSQLSPYQAGTGGMEGSSDKSS